MNRDESLRCIKIAQKAWQSGNASKAVKFLKKSIQLCDNQEARQLLQHYTTQAPPSGTTANETSPPKSSPRQSPPRAQRTQQTNTNANTNNANNTGNTNTNTNTNNDNSSGGGGGPSGEKIDWGAYFNMNSNNSNNSNSSNSSSSASNSYSNMSSGYNNASNASANSSFRSNSSQSPNNSTSNLGSRNSEANRSSSRMTTDEEVKMIRKILRAKDYYEMLGVSRETNEAELKKKYRKLALKLHPDRNKAPGAEEAFKKLSAAYDCLRDSRKRQMYDQYGEDGPQMRSSGMNGQFQQMTPDDIIRMFFGGDFAFDGHQRGSHSTFYFGGPGGFHHHGRRRGGHRSGQSSESDGESRGGLLFTLMQLLPLLFVMFSMFLPTIFSSMNQSGNGNLGYSHGSAWEGQHFSLTRDRIFTREEETSLGTKYWIRNSRNAWGFNPTRNKVALEEAVEVSYLNYLIKQCNDENKLYNDNFENIKSKDMNNKKRTKMLKTLQNRMSNSNSNSQFSIFNSKYQNGNGNGKVCSKLDQYLENLS